MADRFRQLFSRLSEYEVVPVLVELAVLWLLIFAVYRFIRGTRAAGAFKGVLVLLIVATLVLRVLVPGELPRLAVLYDNVLGIAAIALVVTFQPELRRALIRLGEAPFFRSEPETVPQVVDAIVDAVVIMSKNKFGAILAIERRVGMREYIETGRGLNADVSSHLLTSIFWPNSPLHDMGVVIRGNRVIAAGVPFPLADAADMPDAHLGTRHRAAIGLTRVTDALVVVVSEETGAISIAEGGKLKRWLDADALRSELRTRLSDASSASTAEAEEEAQEAMKALPEQPAQSPKAKPPKAKRKKAAPGPTQRAGEQAGQGDTRKAAASSTANEARTDDA